MLSLLLSLLLLFYGGRCPAKERQQLLMPACTLCATPVQEVEAHEQRLQRRSEELSGVERRIAAAQQRLDGEAERLKRAVAAVEEEGAALKASLAACGGCLRRCFRHWCWRQKGRMLSSRPASSCMHVPACVFLSAPPPRGLQERGEELAAREESLEAWKAQLKSEAVRQIAEREQLLTEWQARLDRRQAEIEDVQRAAEV